LQQRRNPRILSAMQTPILPRRLVIALLGIFASIGLSACDQVAALSGPDFEFELQLDLERIAELSEAEDGETPAALTQASMEVIQNRLDVMGITSHAISDQGEGRIRLEVSGLDALAAFENALGITGDLSFMRVDDEADYADIQAGIVSPGSMILPMADGSERIAVRRLGRIRGHNIADASAGYDPITNDPVVNIRFDETGARKFAQMTQANLDRRIAIVLDEEVLSAPIIREPILGGEVQISGSMTAEEAQELAIILQSGSLPVPVAILSQRRLD